MEIVVQRKVCNSWRQIRKAQPLIRENVLQVGAPVITQILVYPQADQRARIVLHTYRMELLGSSNHRCGELKLGTSTAAHKGRDLPLAVFG